MKNQALWDRIEAHSMPGGFVTLLVECTGWPPDRATRAVLEYSRLAYLTALAIDLAPSRGRV
ncbi:hypothetical protein [Nioella aestuarii]|uniref:hypothetical protein n=1 Tax=Nioella aestuarii TaxID=1662864 RepID=UPI003D7F6C8F